MLAYALLGLKQNFSQVLEQQIDPESTNAEEQAVINIVLQLRATQPSNGRYKAAQSRIGTKERLRNSKKSKNQKTMKDILSKSIPARPLEKIQPHRIIKRISRTAKSSQQLMKIK